MMPRAQIKREGPAGPAVQALDPVGFEWNRVDLPIRNLPDALVGTMILHLSDIHLHKRWWTALDVLIERIRSAEADLLLITGDFVNDKVDHSFAVPMAHRLLGQLPARLGTFAILGNHDTLRFAPQFAGTPVNLIDGGRATVCRNGATIELIGLPGVDRELLDELWLDSLPKRQPDVPRIILSHYPDALLRVKGLEPDIVLAGHTHGGQCCLPGGRPLITHDSLPKQYSKGIHWMNGTWLIVNRGFGFAGIPLRVFCPSEVIEIHLKQA